MQYCFEQGSFPLVPLLYNQGPLRSKSGTDSCVMWHDVMNPAALQGNVIWADKEEEEEGERREASQDDGEERYLSNILIIPAS